MENGDKPDDNQQKSVPRDRSYLFGSTGRGGMRANSFIFGV